MAYKGTINRRDVFERSAGLRQAQHVKRFRFMAVTYKKKSNPYRPNCLRNNSGLEVPRALAEAKCHEARAGTGHPVWPKSLCDESRPGTPNGGVNSRKHANQRPSLRSGHTSERVAGDAHALTTLQRSQSRRLDVSWSSVALAEFRVASHEQVILTRDRN